MSEAAAALPRMSSAVAVRRRMAHEIVDAHRTPVTIGEITLHPHQRRAAARLSRLLSVYGGALLADPTGLGKTYIALAAARDVQQLLIVCPAALCDSWRRALALVARDAQVVSVERLSRGAPRGIDTAELVIIDESHHLRNGATNRYDVAATLCDGARVLLLSATPIQNRRDDLTAQLALFLGDAAFAMTDLELARFVVRRDAEASSARLPQIEGPRWLTLSTMDDVLDDIVALPPPVPLADEGDAHVLLRYTLLRQWSSSRAALVAGLRGRLARGVALIAALESGRKPTRRELSAWTQSDDSVQLAIPELLLPTSGGAADMRRLRDAVERHVAAVRGLLDRLRGERDPDSARADLLRDLRRQHAGARMIAFSQYAATVRALSRMLMARDSGIAELTARGGRVAGGRIAREEVLAQLSPSAVHVRTAERIEMLVTTDVSSEGLDLQGASVIVHIDLPWNPARLEQRVGRVRRLGGHHDRVFVYALAPPASSERVLEVEQRLRAKLRLAARLVGIGSASLPAIEDEQNATPELMSDLYTALERWLVPPEPIECDAASAVYAAVAAPVSGYVALLADGDDRMLVASIGANPTLEPSALREALLLAEGTEAQPQPDDLSSAIHSIEEWWRRRMAREELQKLGTEGTRVRARIASRIAALLTDAPRHARAALAASASAAGHTLRTPLGIGAERRLAALADATVADAEWLSRVAELGHARAARARHHDPAILALMLFQRER